MRTESKFGLSELVMYLVITYRQKHSQLILYIGPNYTSYEAVSVGCKLLKQSTKNLNVAEKKYEEI